jgi:hypothetical protein
MESCEQFKNRFYNTDTSMTEKFTIAGGRIACVQCNAMQSQNALNNNAEHQP